MALAEAADRRIARHRTDRREAVGDKRRPRAEPRRRSRRLGSGVAAADHDDIESFAHESVRM
jgi:hypothetical protein